MLKTAIDMIAAALASDTEVTLPYDKKQTAALRETALFLRALSADAALEPENGTVRITPINGVNWNQTLTLSVSQEKLLWLFLGVCVKLNLTARFRIGVNVSDEQIAAVKACYPGRTDLFWDKGDLCVASLVGAMPFDCKSGLPVPFVCGLLLGSVLSFGRSTFHLHNYYFNKRNVMYVLNVLKQYRSNDVLTPYQTYALIMPHLRKDFGYLSGKRLLTDDDKIENARIYRLCSDSVSEAYRRKLQAFRDARRQKHEEKIRWNRAEKKRVAREKFLAELAAEREKGEKGES